MADNTNEFAKGHLFKHVPTIFFRRLLRMQQHKRRWERQMLLREALSGTRTSASSAWMRAEIRCTSRAGTFVSATFAPFITRRRATRVRSAEHRLT